MTELDRIDTELDKRKSLEETNLSIREPNMPRKKGTKYARTEEGNEYVMPGNATEAYVEDVTGETVTSSGVYGDSRGSLTANRQTDKELGSDGTESGSSELTPEQKDDWRIQRATLEQ